MMRIRLAWTPCLELSAMRERRRQWFYNIKPCSPRFENHCSKQKEKRREIWSLSSVNFVQKLWNNDSPASLHSSCNMCGCTSQDVAALCTTEATSQSRNSNRCLWSFAFMWPITHMKKENASLNKFDLWIPLLFPLGVLSTNLIKCFGFLSSYF